MTSYRRSNVMVKVGGGGVLESNNTRVSYLQAVLQYASLLVQTFVLVINWNLKMPLSQGQCYSIKFCVALRKTGAVTVVLLKEDYETIPCQKI
ncbi:hypothetical protein NPIL_260401 [Nephila pilipes]|uniref:Uncharacterized protein n=1 Tax=Nephila pilipes TaxID=299642 RepID=A0A8X6QHY7_NEPPI|nr:hypothetical protein NPIL_260401 [Nephila pilipes]